MCMSFTSFRAPSTTLKQKTIITNFRCYLCSWSVTFWLSCPNNWTCVVFVIGMLHSYRFLFLINFQRHVHSICVFHVYVFLFRGEKRVFELSWVWPWRWPRGGTPYMVFIDPVFHNTIKTCLKRVGHFGYEWVEKEMCRFAEDMS